MLLICKVKKQIRAQCCLTAGRILSAKGDARTAALFPHMCKYDAQQLLKEAAGKKYIFAKEHTFRLHALLTLSERFALVTVVVIFFARLSLRTQLVGPLARKVHSNQTC